MKSASRLPVRWRPRLCGLALVAVASLAWLAAGRVSAAPAVAAVDSVGITVADMDRAVAFYRDVLEFQVVADREVEGPAWERLYGVFGLRLRAVRMRLGGESIELLQFLAPRGRPDPVDSRSNDRWFQHIAIITRDMDRAYARLRAHRVRHASSGPQTLPDWNPNAGGIRAFYFLDPDDNTLEILQFPPGKGDRKWQAAGSGLFLGIDHTAIVVADTDVSLRHYRDLLGLEVAGGSENWGVEQERLNNVFGAHLRITTLRAAAGPGVELLEYLAPRDGRPMPADTRPVDLWYWQVNLRAATPPPAPDALRRIGSGAITIDFAALPANTLRLGRAQVLRDPDGHAALFGDYGQASRDSEEVDR